MRKNMAAIGGELAWTLVFITSVLIARSPGRASAAEPSPSRRMDLKILENKVRGGWAGQMIGVSYGAPVEFRWLGKIVDAEIHWSPPQVNNSIEQDDLYVEMTFAEVMDRLGLDATTEQFGEAFKNSQYHLWHANAAARRNLNRGIKAPMSGHPKNNIHANDIDFQIESDFIGLMCPGLPQLSNQYCDRVGRVMNYGDGLYGGMFFGGMYSAAFFENDPRKVVEQGLACIPAESSYAKLVRDVLDSFAKYPADWKRTWQMMEDKWDKDDSCSEGALRPFNIDAKLNGGYVALGLLYGGGDFSKTLEITTRCGQDADCNPSSAAGILGVILGYEAIPDSWKSGIPAIEDKKFDYTNYSFKDIVKSTLARIAKNIESAGGKYGREEIVVPIQKPKPPKLEQWSMGIPDKLIPADDDAWSWTGKWLRVVDDRGRTVAAAGDGAGGEATLKFKGTAVAVVGQYAQEGGRADVWLDGAKAGDMDAYIVERTHDTDLWHVYDLKPGDHTLRLVLRDDADPRSKGKKMAIIGAISFHNP